MCKASRRIFLSLTLCLLFAAALAAVAPAQETVHFTPGDLVVSVEGCGVNGGTCTAVPNGTGTGTGNSSSTGYGDNQAAPLTLFEYQPSGVSSVTFVNSLTLPQTGSAANLPVSGEYGSSSEGSVQLSGAGQYLTLMGYGINADTFNANPNNYSAAANAALAQTGSLTGKSYTPIPRVVTTIDAYGNVNSSTASYNVFSGNNPRSTYSADGINFYISGQGTSGDATGGVFLTTLGADNLAPTTITGADAGSGAAQDTRTVQIFNNTLYVSVDSKSGATNRSYIGTLGTPPATSVFNSAKGPTQMTTANNASTPVAVTSTGKLVLTAGETNGINSTGQQINLSPENYFFASPSVLYVADDGNPKQTSATSLLGDGGLQKWVNTKSDGTGTWELTYTLAAGLNLVQNPSANSTNTAGTTGLLGLTGSVSNGTVTLYATSFTIGDLDPSYLFGITDTLSATTNPGTSFTQLAEAPQDSNFKGVAFAPSLPTGSATITSSPSGLAFSTSGTGCVPGTYITPVTLIWTPASSCELSVVTPQSSAGAEYAFSQWQDGTTATTDAVTAPSTSAIYNLTFSTSYQLTTSATTGGSVSAGGYYAAGANATVTATPSTGYYFVNFTGTTTSTSNPLTLAMNGPQTITANFAQQQTPVVTFPSASAINYGQTLASSSFTGGSNSVPGTFAFTAPSTAPSAGATAQSVTFTPTNTAEYATVTGSVNVTVNPLAVSVTPNAVSKVYGQTDPAFTGTLTGFLPADNVTATYSRAAGESVAGGPYTINATLSPSAVLSNYNITYNTAQFTISKASLTVTVASPSVTYGSALPTFTSTISGLVNGDASSNAKRGVSHPAVSGTVDGNVDLSVSYATTASSTAPYSGAGTYPITATLSGTGLSNYTIATNTPGTLTINKAPLTVTVASPSVSYGSAPPTLTGTVSGAVNGDAVGTTLTVSYATTASSSAPYSGVGSYPITATLGGASLANYTVSSTPGSLTIHPVALSITVNNTAVTYGSALPVFTSTLTGLVNGDASANLRKGVSRPAVSGTVDGNIDLSITYATTASSTAPYSGVGSYPVTATLSGAAAGNYTIATNTPGTLTINKAPLTVTVASASESYGSALPTLTGTVSGTVNGDAVGTTLTVSYATTASSSSPYSGVGSYPVTATLGGASLANYTVSNTPGSLTINPTSISITVNSASITYGSALPTFTSNLTGLVNGDASANYRRGGIRPATSGSVDGNVDLSVSYSTTASSTAPYSGAGAYPITATLSGAAASNYTIATNTSGTLTINKASLSVTVINASGSYGSALPKLTGLVSGNVNGDKVGSTLTVTYATTASSTSPYSDAGKYPITATVGGSSRANYSLTNTPGSLTIKQASLKVTPTSVSKVYGQADPTLTAAYTGFVNGDTTSVISGSPSLTTTALASSRAGAYPITATLGTLSAGNYSYNLGVKGTLTITKAVLTLTPNSLSKVYGKYNPTLTASYTGFVNGDTVSVLRGAPLLATTAVKSSGVGSYPITAELHSLSAADYSFTLGVQGTLTVSKAVLTVTPRSHSKVYGKANPAFTAFYGGFVNGDTDSVVQGAPSLTTTATTASGVGSYSIDATTGTLSAANYSFAFKTGTLTVNKAVLTVAANNLKMTQGSAVPTLTYTTTGFVNGDSSTSGATAGAPALSTTATSTAPAGSYPITTKVGSLTALNYSFKLKDGTLKIVAK